jgi:ABC-2 type transport system ATP-binding protein
MCRVVGRDLVDCEDRYPVGGGAVTATALVVRELSAQYGHRHVFHDVSFVLPGGQALGVVGPNGAGKTTLLRILVGLISPAQGDIRLDGLPPREALTRQPVGYFGGESTLAASVRAARWGSLASGDPVTTERRHLRTLSRGTRQLLGLRTIFGRQHLRLLVLDEPWEGLDPDAARWLSTAIETKRDRGAALVLSSHRLYDLAGLCDAYLFLVHHRATLLYAHEIGSIGGVTAADLNQILERLQSGAAPRAS